MVASASCVNNTGRITGGWAAARPSALRLANRGDRQAHHRGLTAAMLQNRPLRPLTVTDVAGSEPGAEPEPRSEELASSDWHAMKPRSALFLRCSSLLRRELEQRTKYPNQAIRKMSATRPHSLLSDEKDTSLPHWRDCSDRGWLSLKVSAPCREARGRVAFEDRFFDGTPTQILPWKLACSACRRQRHSMEVRMPGSIAPHPFNGYCPHDGGKRLRVCDNSVGGSNGLS
jgi:hypothetical protein